MIINVKRGVGGILGEATRVIANGYTGWSWSLSSASAKAICLWDSIYPEFAGFLAGFLPDTFNPEYG